MRTTLFSSQTLQQEDAERRAPAGSLCLAPGGQRGPSRILQKQALDPTGALCLGPSKQPSAQGKGLLAVEEAEAGGSRAPASLVNLARACLKVENQKGMWVCSSVVEPSPFQSVWHKVKAPLF